MIVYMDESRLPLAGVPRHLLERRFDEWCGALMHNFGIRFVGGNEHGVTHIDISSASPEGVFAFLESCAACVDLEPGDLQTLAGRSVETLAAADLMQQDPAVRNGCSRLTVEEVMPTVADLIRLALNTSNRLAEADADAIANAPEEIRSLYEYERQKSEQAAVMKMRQFGLDVPDIDPSILDAKPEAAPDEHPDFAGGIANAGSGSPWNFTE